ncbi:UvrD-helicase domain-containing protein [Nocardia sp. alder85J]|uniref:UvrD-helicase domain-containing protein n=1 Tax=Nocardia sp. alder85J TaxID=2862949 RepID=UPI001CD5CA2B|nr:UvrD-helicase domain-containing protein [Nocardia sp. alder85J]MCX4092288.1 UvrD-helicase domain-containing protein [Nocardia sp. alder85J]
MSEDAQRTGHHRTTPRQLADALGLPPPTDEQAAVIAAPPGPTLVVAGAGAGKTETMAARVVWMVANGFVVPDQVLGLTFTRKAAQQLTTRIRTRLSRLAGAPLLREIDPGGRLRALLTGSEPEISTYHSYAGRLLSEHGLLMPVEPSSTLLTETQLWQLAHRVVTAWDGDLDTDRTPVSVTEAVLALSGQLAEHLVEPEQLVEAHAELEKLILTLPKGPRQRGGPSKELMSILEAQHERVALLPLVRRLAEELRRRGALDFSSQMSLAARLAAEHHEVGRAERTRFRLVLLDEYQDTGHAQRILLAALFGDPAAARGSDPPDPGPPGDAVPEGRWRLAVTAVGDPMQSIYGWRGASAANLPRFATDFPYAPGVPAPILPLLTSWRNPPEALDLANLVADPLRDSGVAVDALRPRPDAAPGIVALALTETVAEERDWLAERIAAEWEAHADAGLPPPTSAVLVRRNADATPLAEALRERGLPVEIVGLGGLLATPEVADVVATLRLIADPGSGGAAMRVLTGARWRIGVSDLAALARRARELSILKPAEQVTTIADPVALAEALRAVAPEPAEQAGLADAIADPGAPDQYSEAGHARIVTLSRELAALRERSGQSLPELVADVERTIGVGVETQARRAAAGGGAGREHLDAFAEVVAGYSAGDHRATLPGLLAFLTAAEEVENGLEPGEVEVARDRVQVLTVHAAKGLEWEVVAVPHVVRGVFPSGTAAGTWLGALAELPTALRGDRQRDPDGPGDTAASEGVPVLDLENLYDRADLQRALDQHKDALHRRRIDEERRLFYVALTRTERALFVSAHHWAETGATPKGPSDFLLELKHATEIPGSPSATAVRVDAWAEPPDADAVNPFTDNPTSASWPRDPLGKRRAAVESGAALVRAALAQPVDPEPAPPARTPASTGRHESATTSGQFERAAVSQPGSSEIRTVPGSSAVSAQSGQGGAGPVEERSADAPGPSGHGKAGTPTPDVPAPLDRPRQLDLFADLEAGTLADPADFGPPPDPEPADPADERFPADAHFLDDIDGDPDGWAADVDALLAEFLAAESGETEVELPAQLPATALVEMRADPAKLAARLRRPLPFPPSPFARRGTAFHAWLQRWFGATQLLDLDALPGAADGDDTDADLVRLQEAFLSSPWAERNPVEVEIAFETSIAGTLLRGRMDAVFAESGGRWLVVDWKTGSEPTRAEEAAVAMQLAVYRLAWARLIAARTGAPEAELLTRIGAAFHYVRTGRTIAPRHLSGPDELARLVESAAPAWHSAADDESE